MNYEIAFNKKAKSLIMGNDTFIFKANLELWKLFFTSLHTKWMRWGLSHEMVMSYLDKFQCVEDITPVKIELYYSDIVIDNMIDTLYLYDYEKYEGNGIYLIYNEYDDLIYIGMSTCIQARALQSFISKFPYGATSIKIIDLNNFDKDIVTHFESVLIHQFQPLYNNTIEKVENLSHRYYHNILMYFRDKTNECKKMVITSRKSNIEYEDELIFEN